MPIKIAITVNKSDVWFCRICVASIRYYYPNVEIYIIKDYLKGGFSTTELETYWGVKEIQFNAKKFGWSAAKIFLYTDPRFRGEKWLVLDADIVFTGKVLDLMEGRDADVHVSAESCSNIYEDWVKKTYFDVQFVKKLYPEYQHPGYFFNAGQLCIKIGSLPLKEIEDFFDFNKYPFWKRLEEFPLVDQSMLNVLVPIWENRNQIKVDASCRYMLWSEEVATKNLDLAIIKNEGFSRLIHWAGAKRTPQLHKMTRSDILVFFEAYYYNKIPFAPIKKQLRLTGHLFFVFSNKFIQKVKKSFFA